MGLYWYRSSVRRALATRVSSLLLNSVNQNIIIANMSQVHNDERNSDDVDDNDIEGNALPPPSALEPDITRALHCTEGTTLDYA